jgi:SAM-dependent methyltransferase
VPDPATALRAVGDRFRTRWQDAHARFRRFASPPWWAPGLVISPDLRAAYERDLPVAAFCRDLARVARACLPHPSWVPDVLRVAARAPCTCGGDSPGIAPDAPASVPDLWARLPDSMAGRVDYRDDEWVPLFCALADPSRFGTSPDRYPDQDAWIGDRLAATGPDRRAILDLGCGVGLGTWALARRAVRQALTPCRVTGITRQPLEAWMAAHRHLPHDPIRERDYPGAEETVPVDFIAADVRQVPLRGAYPVVVCNGLVGGEWLHRDTDVLRLLAELRRLLAPDGAVCLANRFHDGRLPVLHRVMATAADHGWHVSGTPRNLVLARPGG